MTNLAMTQLRHTALRNTALRNTALRNAVGRTARRLAVALACGLFAAAAADVPAAAAAGPPEWIWLSEQSSPGDVGQLTREFALDQSVQSLRLRGGADFCIVEVRLNGQLAAQIDSFADWFELDLTRWAVRGANRLELRLRAASSGPPAVALSLEAEWADGQRRQWLSDAQWVAEPSRWKTASLGHVASAVWPPAAGDPLEINPLDDYTQWKRALGVGAEGDSGSFQLPAGRSDFEFERLLLARPDQSSWVSMAFDAEGRITIGREDRGLLRVELREEGAPRVQQLEDTLEECRGLVYVGGSLYASANNTKGLFRLAPRDGWLDIPRKLRDDPGGVGHGRNDLAVGADGKLYSIRGDSVDLPQGGEVRDRTSPFRAARRGEKTKEGAVVQLDTEGRQPVVVCAGLRNPFGIAENREGEWFTYDADAEFDMGAPWYRPTRLVQLVSGADYGWRGVTGSWPPYDPDGASACLPQTDIGKGSPTAIKFGYGSRFPDPYADALYLLDWAYGRVVAVHMTPRGAGYRCRKEMFLRGQPLNVTDLEFGRDGAMYLITGGRKTQSALYRVRYLGPQTTTPPETSEQRRRRDTHAEAARKLRRELASLHRPEAPAAGIDQLWPHLGSDDPLIRHAARTALEHQPVERWRDRALQERDPAIAVEALLAVTRSRPAQLDALLARLNQLPWQRLTASQRLTLLECDQLCLALLSSSRAAGETGETGKAAGAEPAEAAPQLTAAQRGAWVARLRALLAAAPPREFTPVGQGRTVARRAAALLMQLQDAASVGPLAERLAAAQTQQEQMHYLFALRHARHGWTAETRRQYFLALRDGQQYLGGDGMPGFLKRIREEAVATLTDEERQSLGDLVAPDGGAAPAFAPRTSVVRKWTAADLAPHLSRAEQGRDFQQGRRLYDEALCSQCHRVGGAGKPVGPELTSVGGRFSLADLVASVVDPDQVVAEKYRKVEIETRDGRRLTGRPAPGGDYRSPTVRLVADPLKPDEIVEIPKQDILRQRTAPGSPMPLGLLNPLELEEILDLLAFVRSGADPRHPAFANP